MKEPRTEFGRELRRLRREGPIKYSQSQLAKLSGVTTSHISQLETGERTRTPRVIRRLSPHLGVKPNQLLMKLGMVEMDLAGTLANNRDQVKRKMPNLPEEQLEELASYLTYLHFKASIYS